MRHKNIRINGTNVSYVQAGQGPVVLLLHGLGASKVTWTCNVEPLAQAGFTVLALDLPGHGDSDKPRHLSYDPLNAAKLIYDFSRALGVDRLSLVGSSAGGLMVGLFALEHPEMTDRLVLVGSGGLGKQLPWFLRAISLPVVGDLFYLPGLYKKMGATKRIFYRPPPFVDEVIDELQRVRTLPGARRAALRSIRSSIDYSGLRRHRYIVDRLKDSPVPLMTVWGENDIIIPISHAHRLRRELPDSAMHIIPECGHWPHMEKADQFNRLLLEFLERSSVDVAAPRLDAVRRPAPA